MKPRILYIMSSYNLYGGTPKKTLDLMNHFGEQSALYVYHDKFPELKSQFETSGGKIYEGFYGKRIHLHIRKLLSIIDNEGINIIQTQFFMGETLGYIIKRLRPNVRIIIAFVGPFKPNKLKSFLSRLMYRRVDQFVFVTQYVESEKRNQFPILRNKRSVIIHNGTEKRRDNGKPIPEIKRYAIFDIAGLIAWKNITILIEALNILINSKNYSNVFLYIAGDGPLRGDLERIIGDYHLQEHIFLLGYQSNVGAILDSCNLFVHPCYKEGFGIAVAEAMLAQKPIIVSDAGALPELIDHEKTGLIASAHDANAWADAILRLIRNPKYADHLAFSAKEKAQNEFSIERFVKDYNNLYKSILALNE